VYVKEKFRDAQPIALGMLASKRVERTKAWAWALHCSRHVIFNTSGEDDITSVEKQVVFYGQALMYRTKRNWGFEFEPFHPDSSISRRKETIERTVLINNYRYWQNESGFIGSLVQKTALFQRTKIDGKLFRSWAAVSFKVIGIFDRRRVGKRNKRCSICHFHLKLVFSGETECENQRLFP